MEATLTNISCRYRAPVRYVVFAAGFLFVGGVAAFFFAVLTPWIFRAIMIFLMTVGFMGGLAFLAAYIKSFGGCISFSQDAVMLPYRRKWQSVMLAYSDISIAEEMHDYGRRLTISTRDGRDYVLDETWTPKGRFDEILAIFREKTQA